MNIDFHIHSEYSYDSRLSIEKIIRIGERKGLDGVAITDHDNFEGVKASRKMDIDNFTIVEGEEVTSDRGDILGLFIQEEIESRNYLEVIEEIKDQGGLAIIPHPFDTYRGEYFKDIEDVKDLIDGVEVFNGRIIQEGANRKAKRFAENNNLIKTAGSDSHTRFGIGNCYVNVEASNIREFRKGLEEGHIQIKGKESPFFVHFISKFNSLVTNRIKSTG